MDGEEYVERNGNVGSDKHILKEMSMSTRLSCRVQEGRQMRYVLVLAFSLVLGVAEIVPAFADLGPRICQYHDGTIVQYGPGSCDPVPYWRDR